MRKSTIFWLLVLSIFTIIMNYLYFYVDISLVNPTFLSILKTTGLWILDIVVGFLIIIGIIVPWIVIISKSIKIFNRWLDNL